LAIKELLDHKTLIMTQHYACLFRTTKGGLLWILKSFGRRNRNDTRYWWCRM